MGPTELLKELDSGKFRPVYYFYGSEEYRIKEAAKAMVKRFLPSQTANMNHTVLSGNKGKITDILTELSIIPMIGERQIFTIADIQSLQPGDVEKILSMLEPADPNRIVILTSPSAKTPRKNTKMYKLLTSKTAAIEFARLTSSASERKIRFMLNEQNISIDPEAMKVLIELSGGDMGGLVAETEKLINYVGEGGTIGKETISEVSSDYQAFQIYELADAAGALNLDKALKTMNFLLNKGEKSSGLMFWIGEHFIGLYLAKNGKPVRQGNRDMSWKYKNQLHLFDNERLERIIELIAQADRDLRQNIGPDRNILEKLIIDICSSEDVKS